MYQQVLHQHLGNNARRALGDLTNNNLLLNTNDENNSRIKEARLGLSLLTGSSLDPPSISSVPTVSSSYDNLEEKATPLKKRKRVNSVAILRRTKPRKDVACNENALKLEMKNDLGDLYNSPVPSPILDHLQQFPKVETNDRASSSLGTINPDALYSGDSGYQMYQIEDGKINMLDTVEGVSTIENHYQDGIPSHTFTEKDSIIESERSLTNMTWLGQLGATDTIQPQQPHTLITSAHFPQIIQPMVQHRQRPPYSYSALIQFAISSSSTGRMTLRDIYQWIEDNFPFFRTAKPGWKNSIRHNLSLHKMFIRQPPPGPGKSAFWTLEPGTVVRLPSKRNLNFHNENTVQSSRENPALRNTHVNQSGSAVIGHQTKKPFLLPRPNPAIMQMPVIWNPNTGTYSIMQPIPNNMMLGDSMPYGTNGMVLKPQQNSSVIKIAPKITKFDVNDRLMNSSHGWPPPLPQTGHLAVDSGFETDTSGGINMFEFANASDMKPNYISDVTGGPVIKTETVVSTPVKNSNVTPSKGISATSTPAKLFSELAFLSPIRGVSNTRTNQSGFSPLEKYLTGVSPSFDKTHKSPMLGSLREFGLPGFTPKKEDEMMNVSVHNQSFEEIFGDMNISLDMAAAAADISWSAF
ncbi:uncharacterized protein [Antedon mediterranea]|uniref:uncharacterized protein n=1 Tax=Antedon mediterranea TaxID=105859 RepID=UPI003AF5F15F